MCSNRDKPCFRSVSEVMQDLSRRDSIVVLTSFDLAYIDLAPHLALKLSRLKVRDFLLVVYDNDLARALESNGLGCRCLNLQAEVQETFQGRPKIPGHIKLHAAELFLKEDVSIIVSEADVVWFDNAVNDIRQKRTRGNDTVFFSLAGSALLEPLDFNIGFFFMDNSLESKRILQEVNSQLRENPAAFDQEIFSKSVSGNPGYRVEFLPRQFYAFEDYFLKTKVRHVFKPQDELSDVPLVAHVVGGGPPKSRIHVMAEHQQLEDWNNYYSDKNRKYLAYTTFSVTNTSAALDIFKYALLCSLALNRTLVLPTFLNPHTNFRNTYHGNLEIGATCTAERVLSIKALQKIAGGYYRESSFFCNKQTPGAVRSDVHFAKSLSYNITQMVEMNSYDESTTLHLGDILSLDISLVHADISTVEYDLTHKVFSDIITCPPSDTGGLGYGPVCEQ